MNYDPVIRNLVDAGVEFVLVGGWAAVLHGSSYITYDLDICYSRRRENLKRLAAVLAPLHPRLRDLPTDLPFIWDESTLRNSMLFTLLTDIGEIDLLGEVLGVGNYEAVRAASIPVRVADREVFILDLPALIRSKRAAGRQKDLLILPELEALLEAQEPERPDS